MGAGLGGGSSDAAFFINAINQHFKLGMNLENRKNMAAQLGSDCPFFIENKALLATGKGEVLEAIDLDLSAWHIIVVHPNIHSDTRLAYAGIQANADQTPLKSILKRPLEEWKAILHNDFEPSVSNRYPEIQMIKNQLYNLGATYAAMSGSGSAIFGIFKNEIQVLPIEWNTYSVYKGILN
jgi:4-diphosphocytidyl-2-C-methyl-D-erythritol kinase